LRTQWPQSRMAVFSNRTIAFLLRNKLYAQHTYVLRLELNLRIDLITYICKYNLVIV
jgi:hypothetical protein